MTGRVHALNRRSRNTALDSWKQVTQVAALLLASLVWPADGRATQSTVPSTDSVPKSARAALNKALPGWRPAVPSELPGVAASCDSTASASNNGALQASADFDGDLRQDTALYVDVDGAEKLVIVLDRAPDFPVFQLTMPSPGMFPLTVRKQGQRHATTYAGSDDFLSNDTLSFTRCEGGTSLFLWRGQSFERFDVPTTSPSSSPTAAPTPPAGKS